MIKSILQFLLVVVVIGAIIFGCIKYFDTQKVEEDKWQVKITNESINVRNDHDIYADKVATVNLGEVYNVLDMFIDDTDLVWYKINYSKSKEGWIGSPRNESYVKESNNPKGQDETSYFIDNRKPVIRYYVDDYIVQNLESITYDHLDIEEDSEYEITHEVFYEEHPTDREEPQYWIRYTVTDANGNYARKVQRIIFKEEPTRDQVKDFSEMRSS